ncbi:NUMOD4 domain-containing protein [Cytobacillus pseudoceanisediminis]|uniref:NUMOD4 domain-containing protein n=1 Tax=Bacillaceae TaxID=186817 RepID=UPI001A904105|nr:NUMOD4 domain-containing protein [Bacillus sp. NTK034]MBN8199186.1 hypothetical protein [Bacillus sp. NTK034]
MESIEVWKDIDGYEGIYQISSMGRVRSIDRLSRNGRRLKGKIKVREGNPYGFHIVKLIDKEGIAKNHKVAELLKKYFVKD